MTRLLLGLVVSIVWFCCSLRTASAYLITRRVTKTWRCTSLPEYTQLSSDAISRIRHSSAHSHIKTFLSIEVNDQSPQSSQKKSSLLVRGVLWLKSKLIYLWNVIVELMVEDYKRKHNLSSNPSLSTKKALSTSTAQSHRLSAENNEQRNTLNTGDGVERQLKSTREIVQEDRLWRERRYIENRLKDIERLRQERAKRLQDPTSDVMNNRSDSSNNSTTRSNFNQIKNSIAYLAPDLTDRQSSDISAAPPTELDFTKYTILTNRTRRGYTSLSDGDVIQAEGDAALDSTLPSAVLLTTNEQYSNSSTEDITVSSKVVQIDLDLFQITNGTWKLTEERYENCTKLRSGRHFLINLDDILEDELEFNANGTLTSSLTGSLGKTWSTSVLNLNSSVANATSVGPNEGGDVIIQFLVERGCSLPVFSQATDGTVVAKVNRPPPSPYDQSPTKCLYKGNIVGNRLLGNVYKATNRPDSLQESSYDHETNLYEQIGIFQLSRSL